VIAKILTPEDNAAWNAFVAGWPDFVLMQAHEWGAFKASLSWEAVRIGVEQDGRLVAGAQVLLKRLPFRWASIAYVPRGPLVDWRDATATQTLLEAIHCVARRARAISLKIEPALPHTPAALQLLDAQGFRPSRYTNQPRCSIVIDLRPELQTILANMSRSTRRNIQRGERNGVQVRMGDASDLPTFYQLMQRTFKRAGLPARSFAYYAEEWKALAQAGQLKLYLATYAGQVLAVSMDATLGAQAASFHGGSLETHHHLKPNDLLLWECLKSAKAQGCQTYDVWGIPDEVGELLSRGETIPAHQTGGLWGVYYFKRGFGGKIIYYVGAHDFVYSRPLYRLLDALLARLGSVDKLAQLDDRLGQRLAFTSQCGVTGDAGVRKV